MRKIIMLIVALALAMAMGCATKKVETQQEETAKPEPQVVEEKTEVVVVEPEPVEAQPTPRELYEQMYNSLPTSYTVAKGDCLWCIAEQPQIYNDPFMWPLIYKANRDQIKDPDLIYPAQVFTIERYGFTVDGLKADRKSAGAPWKSLEPPPSSNLPADIRAELGYGF